MTIPTKYTELTEEKKAFYETPEGKAVLEATGEEQQKAWELYKKIKAEEKHEAYQEKKYEKKKYFDVDHRENVWIPRIVKLLIFIIFILICLNVGNYYEDGWKYR